MTVDQIEQFIWDEIQKRGVIFQDMIGMPGYGVDTNPEDNSTPRNQRIRSNRFKEIFGSGRMKELLCVGEHNQYDDFPPLKISLQDLFVFWWNRCVEQHLFVDEILEDIFNYFTEEMRPPEKETEQMDLTLDCDQLPLFTLDLEQAA